MFQKEMYTAKDDIKHKTLIESMKLFIKIIGRKNRGVDTVEFYFTSS
jgi:hypothetical protein